MKFNCLVAAGLLLGSVLGAPAQVFEISPFYGYRFGGSLETVLGEDTDLDAGPAYGLELAFAPYDSDSMKLELFWSRQESQVSLDQPSGVRRMDVLVDEFLIGGTYEMGTGRLRETVSALLGATVFSPDDGEQEVRFSFGIGVGVKYYLLKNLAVRADLRGYCTVVEAETAFISIDGVTVAYFSGDAFWQGEISGGLTLSF